MGVGEIHGHHGHGGPNQGPLDLVPGALAAYSQRALTAAWTGNVVNIWNKGTTATSDFAVSFGQTGADYAAAILTFLNGSEGRVFKWYDQTSHHLDLDHVGVTEGPVWDADLANNLPGMTIGHVPFDTLTSSAGTVLAGTAMTVFIVIDISISNGDTPELWEIYDADTTFPVLRLSTDFATAGDLFVYQYNPAVNGSIVARWATPVVLTDGVHVVQVNFTAGGAVSIFVDGVDAGATLRAGAGQAMTSTHLMIAYPNDLFAEVANNFEGLFYASALSAGDVSTLTSNLVSYYG